MSTCFLSPVIVRVDEGVSRMQLRSLNGPFAYKLAVNSGDKVKIVSKTGIDK